MIFAIFLLSGGAASAAYFGENLNDYNEYCDNEYSESSSACDSLQRVYATEIAAAVSVLCCIVFSTIMIWWKLI